MADYYVNASTGNDASSGLTSGNARKHIYAAISLLPSPITGEETIHLEGTVASPEIWNEETSNEIDLSGVTFTGSGNLTITSEWYYDNYKTGADPYTENADPGTLDPEGAKPCKVLATIKTGENPAITVRGIHLQKPAYDATDPGIDLEDGDDFNLVYCRIEGFTFGAVLKSSPPALSGKAANIENCHFTGNGVGLLACRSQVELTGGNLFADCGRFGIRLVDKARATFAPFSDALNTTTISTQTAKKRYAAIQAEFGSEVVLEQTSLYDPDEITRCYLKILDRGAYKGTEYFGVALESGSQLVGAANVFFADPEVSDGADTVPAGQQIVTSGDGSASVIK